jgi:hypothetical protein
MAMKTVNGCQSQGLLGDFVFEHEFRRGTGHFVRWVFQPVSGTRLIFNRQPVTVDFVRNSNGIIVFTVDGELRQSEAWPWEFKIPA